jgi:hypothetical protein
MTDDAERDEARDEEAEPEAPHVPTTWKEARAEIAQEPGNHGSFAFGCSIAVIVAVVAFFVVRVFLMR